MCCSCSCSCIARIWPILFVFTSCSCFCSGLFSVTAYQRKSFLSHVRKRQSLPEMFPVSPVAFLGVVFSHHLLSSGSLALDLARLLLAVRVRHDDLAHKPAVHVQKQVSSQSEARPTPLGGMAIPGRIHVCVCVCVSGLVWCYPPWPCHFFFSSTQYTPPLTMTFLLALATSRRPWHLFPIPHSPGPVILLCTQYPRVYPPPHVLFCLFPSMHAPSFDRLTASPRPPLSASNQPCTIPERQVVSPPSSSSSSPGDCIAASLHLARPHVIPCGMRRETC